MRLLLERVSARRTGNEYGVFDETTGKCVGTVSFDKVPRASHKSYPTRTIRLFDSKYVGIFNTHMECVAFVKGVEVVLDYMLKVKDVKSAESLLNHMLEAKEKPSETEE
jgi:pentatricopeptide repeat protein